jgi:hypothetical protein
MVRVLSAVAVQFDRILPGLNLAFQLVALSIRIRVVAAWRRHVFILEHHVEGALMAYNAY